MFAKEIISDIIKSHIKHNKYSQAEVSLLSGIDQVTLSRIINGKEEISLVNSKKLARVFDDLKDDELFLFRIYSDMKEFETLDERDSKILEGIEEYKGYKNFKLLDKFSKMAIVRKIIDGGSLKKFEKFILKHSISFSKYKDSPKAKLWLVLMYRQNKNLKNVGNFKKSTKKTVYKKVFDIFFKLNVDIHKRIKKIQNELSSRGIIVQNGPYFKGSLVKGVSFIRNTSRFIFLTDMYKREYRWLISLVHELIHFYENLTNENEIENYAILLIKQYIATNEIIDCDFDVFFKAYNNKQNQFLDNKEDYFEKLRAKTKRNLSFGHPQNLINLLNI